MAVEQCGITVGRNKKEFVGLSADTKPTNCGAGSTFWELDTRAAYIYDGISAWYLI